jgi:hypothetical protein
LTCRHGLLERVVPRCVGLLDRLGQLVDLMRHAGHFKLNALQDELLAPFQAFLHPKHRRQWKSKRHAAIISRSRLPDLR